MAQDTTPAIICYQGDGSNSVFDVPFDKGYYGEVRVLFVRRGLADYTYNPNTYTVSGRLYAWANGGAIVYTHTPNPTVGAPTYNSLDVEQVNTVTAIVGQTITVDSLTYTRAVQHDLCANLKLTWTGDTLQVGDFICIVRDTERGQPYEMPNNQKHIERALDNIERQVQELKDGLDRTLTIDPSYPIPSSHKMNPVNWLKSIIRCMDFSVRAVRFANGWFDYSLDDPNIADGDKTWYHLLNTDNIKSIRERKEIVDGIEHRWVEYLDQDGQWRTISDSAWDSRITEAERVANEAHSIAEEAISTANDADQKSDDAVDYARHAMDVAAGITGEKFVFTITSGQTTLHFDDDIEDKIIDLYWQGQYITESGNWTVSGDTITMLFGPETGDTVVVILNQIRQVVNQGDLDAHNTDPTAHANIINTHNTSLSAHANLMAAHNADNSAHANIITAHNTSASAHSTLFAAKATKVTVRRW